MKLRLSIGIFFSLTLHLFLISLFFRGYPSIFNNEEFKWRDWIIFPNREVLTNKQSELTKKNFLDKKITRDVIFPDLLIVINKSKNLGLEKKSTRQISINSILAQVEKFPENIEIEKSSNEKFSFQVGELLTLLTPVKLKSSMTNEGELNFNELKQFRSALDVFLSERWEVPMHLSGNNYSVLVKFEIRKNGRLVKWKIVESSNSLIEKTLKNLLKNLQFLPSLPESYPEDSYKFAVKFSPFNIK